MRGYVRSGSSSCRGLTSGRGQQSRRRIIVAVCSLLLELRQTPFQLGLAESAGGPVGEGQQRRFLLSAVEVMVPTAAEGEEPGEPAAGRQRNTQRGPERGEALLLSGIRA